MHLTEMTNLPRKPAAFPPEIGPGTNWIGGWVVSESALDKEERRHAYIWNRILIVPYDV
jgi:hypothetical protein